MVEKHRCSWVNLNNSDYIKYHDEVWGVELHDDKRLFLELSMEILQAGLKYETVYNKREDIILAFDGFDPYLVMGFDSLKINELLNNKNIIRSVGKIRAIINNARVFIDIQRKYNSFNNYIWHFTNNKVIVECGRNKSFLSDMVCSDLKSLGMRGIGSITIYSYLSAIGVINAHEECCYLRKMRCKQ